MNTKAEAELLMEEAVISLPFNLHYLNRHQFNSKLHHQMVTNSVVLYNDVSCSYCTIAVAV